MLVTITDVHEAIEGQDTVSCDALTHDRDSRNIVVMLPVHVGDGIKQALARGDDVNLSVTPGQIVRHAESSFRKTAEEFLAQSNAIAPTINPEDQKIIDAMHSLARAVAEHENAMIPGACSTDEELFHYAKERRAAEANWNALLMKRVNELAGRYKATL